MALFQFLLTSDNAGSPNKFYLDSDNVSAASAISFSSAQGQQASLTVSVPSQIAVNAKQQQQSTVAMTQFAAVLLVAPVYNGAGSIGFAGNFTAVAGNVVAYDPNAVVVYSDGTVAAVNYGTSVAQFDDGTGYAPFLITFTSWNVFSQQQQQSAVALINAAQIGFASQQQQQFSASVIQASGLAFTSLQAQQASAQVSASIATAFDSRQAQQSSVNVLSITNIAANAKQAQQVTVGVGAIVAPAFDAKQQQQSAISVSVPVIPVVALDAKQVQQSSLQVGAGVSPSANAQQGQQAVAAVVVPFRPAIAAQSQQNQQSSFSVIASATLQADARQQQQASANVLSFSKPTFNAQQGQQGQFSLPTLGAVVVSFSSQQRQQILAEVGAAVAVEFYTKQGQKVSVTILPKPGEMIDIDPELITIDANAYYNDKQPYTKVVYLGRDNAALIEIFYDGSPIDLQAVNQIKMQLVGTDVIVDSNDSPDYIQWTPGSNVIKFKIGTFPGLPYGIYPVELVLFDPLHDDGQAIAGPGLPLLMFDFIQDKVA